MMSKQSTDLPLRDGLLLQGYQKKLKTMKKKYFVLFDETASNCSRLEYFDNEKKFKSGSAPKRIIKLKNCFNINRRLDTKHEFVIALSTKDYAFGIVLESEPEMIEWLETLITLQRYEDPSCAKPRIHFEHVWQVIVQRKGLAENKGLVGTYHVCLTSQSLTFIKIGLQKHKEHRRQNIEIMLTTIRRCGDSHCFFYMEVGRQSIIGPGELWMETEDSLIAQNMHNMILSAMSTKSDNHKEPMRQRSLSANETSKPTLILQRYRTRSGNNTHVSSYKLGSLNGRERCDSLPTSRNRNPSDCSTLSLTNLAILPSRNILSNELQKPVLNQGHSNSLPPSTTTSCSKGEKSSLGFDGEDDDGFLLAYRFHSRSPQGVIPEEKNEDILNFDKNCDENSKSFLNTSNNLKEPTPDAQNCFENRKGSSLLSENTYLPKQIRSICSDFSIRSSKLLNNNAENYTFMGPMCCDVNEYISNIKGIENYELFPSICLKNPGFSNSFFELASDHFQSNIEVDGDITTKSEGPIRTYSIGNRPEQNKIQMGCLKSSKADASISRVRAFSVGSKTRTPSSDIQRGILNNRSSTKRFSNCIYNNSDSIMVTTNNQLINLNSYHDKKSTSAPLLNKKSQNSYDQVSDLMEIDFSKSQNEITASLGWPYHSSFKTSNTNPVQLEAQKVFKSNNTFKSCNANYSSLYQVSENNGYLEMKPVSSNLDLIPKETKDGLPYQFKLPVNQNGSSRLFCEFKNNAIFKTPQSLKYINKLEINDKRDDKINYAFNDTSNVNEYKTEIIESLTNDNSDFKLKNVNKTIKNCKEVVKEYCIQNTEADTFNDFQLFCLKDHSLNEQRSKNIFDAKSTNACNEDAYNMLTNQSEMSRNLSRIFLKYTIHRNESGYETLRMKSECSLLPKIIYQLPKSDKLDLHSSSTDVTRTNSIKNGYFPFFTPLSKSSGSSPSIYRPLSIENSPDYFELKSVHNTTSEQQTSNVFRPQLVSSDLELCYASLDLPQYQYENNYTVRSRNKSLIPMENIFADSRTGSQPSFSYAKINFDNRDLSTN